MEKWKMFCIFCLLTRFWYLKNCWIIFLCDLWWKIYQKTDFWYTVRYGDPIKSSRNWLFQENNPHWPVQTSIILIWIHFRMSNTRKNQHVTWKNSIRKSEKKKAPDKRKENITEKNKRKQFFVIRDWSDKYFQ